MAKRDYYEILGVTRTATQIEIKKAYKKVARDNHPDRNQGDEAATQRFKEAAEAYQALSDEKKRGVYDQYGHEGLNGNAAQFHDLNDIFDAFGGIFGDLFGSGGGRRSRGGVRQGARIEAEVTLDLREAATGCERTLKLKRLHECETCEGSGAKAGTSAATCDYCGGHGQVVQSQGFFRVQTTCPACRGEGKVIRDKCPDCRGRGLQEEPAEVTVPIPAGVDNGMQVRVPGEGHEAQGGGPAGDLYVHIHVKEHPLFHREGVHLTCTIPITFTQAALGTELEVPILTGTGRQKLTISPGTQPGETFTLRGQGMPQPHSSLRGDLYVEINVEVPKKLSEEQEELLRKLAELEKSNVSPHQKSFFETLKDWFSGGDD